MTGQWYGNLLMHVNEFMHLYSYMATCTAVPKLQKKIIYALGISSLPDWFRMVPLWKTNTLV